MRSDASQSELVGCVSGFIGREGEIDISLWPVQVAGAVVETLFPSDFRFQLLQERVQAVEIRMAGHSRRVGR